VLPCGAVCTDALHPTAGQAKQSFDAVFRSILYLQGFSGLTATVDSVYANEAAAHKTTIEWRAKVHSELKSRPSASKPPVTSGLAIGRDLLRNSPSHRPGGEYNGEIVGEKIEHSPVTFSFTDHFIGRRVSLNLGDDGKLQSPVKLRALIKSPLELMKAAAWFFARRSSGIKRHREELPPPLSHMLAEVSPWVPVRVMCGCVATACRRLTTAPAGVHVASRTIWRWAGWMMQRVTRDRVSRVQVPLLLRALALCVERACRKRWLICRFVNQNRSRCIELAAFFILCLQSAAALQIVGRPGVVDAAGVSDGALVYLHIVADSDCVNDRTHNQSTPLHASAMNGHLETCRLLLQCNADVDAKDMK
jgi:hypothetical protein